MLAFNEPYLQNVGYLLTYAGSCVGVLKFCGLIYLLGQRFRYLNEQVDRQLEVRGEQFDLVKANAVIKVSRGWAGFGREVGRIVFVKGEGVVK